MEVRVIHLLMVSSGRRGSGGGGRVPVMFITAHTCGTRGWRAVRPGSLSLPPRLVPSAAPRHASILHCCCLSLPGLHVKCRMVLFRPCVFFPFIFFFLRCPFSCVFSQMPSEKPLDTFVPGGLLLVERFPSCRITSNALHMAPF